MVALKRLQASGDLDAAAMSARQQVLLVAHPDLSTCAQVTAGLAQSAELMLRLYSLTVQANMSQLAGVGGQSTEAAAAAVGGARPGAGPARGNLAGRGAGRRGQGRGRGRGNANDSPSVLHNKVGRHPDIAG